MLESQSSIFLPAPPPPPQPVASARPDSVMSDDSGQTLRPHGIEAVVREAQEREEQLKEVSVDDLTQEISKLSTLVLSLSTDLTALVTQRDQIIAAGPLATPAQLVALSKSTTDVGSALVTTLPTALQTTSLRLARLEALAATGSVAALPQELATLREGLLTARVDASRIEKEVRRAAWDEVDARESARRRLEEKVRAENTTLGESAVEEVVRTAFVGAQTPVARLDVLSYAGRVALENPATEIAQLLDEAGERNSLDRSDTRYSGATTLVDPYADPSQTEGYNYGKLDHEHDDSERVPLARVATSSTRHDGADGDEEAQAGTRGIGALSTGGSESKKLSRWALVQLNWRDYLVRLALVVSSIGLVVGVVVYQSIAQRQEAEAATSSLSSSTSLPEATTR